MTPLKQLEANRRNALKSTDPRIENGKKRLTGECTQTRLTAETALEPLENPEEYRTFEAAFVLEYLPQTPV